MINTINEDEIINDYYCLEEEAIAWLLINEILFLNNVSTWNNEETTAVFVNCGDTFAYACSDAETIKFSDGDRDSEIIQLYEMCKENLKYGSTKWCCMKRNQKPIKELVDMMKEAGVWCEKMENLKDNQYEINVRKLNEK